MAAGADVGVHPERDGCDLAHGGGDRRQRLGLAEGLEIELEEAAVEGEAHFLLCLADTREDDFLRRDPSGPGAPVLASRDDVGAQSLFGERREDGGVWVRLHCIADQRVMETLQR